MEEKKFYIGCKVITAVPMTSREFADLKNQEHDHENAPGYMVTYPDGYKSWSPKKVFETAYRQITTEEAVFLGMIPTLPQSDDCQCEQEG
jgi:hypothetical protein